MLSGRIDIQVKKESDKFTVVYSHLHKALNLVISRCFFAARAERLFFLIKPTVLWFVVAVAVAFVVPQVPYLIDCEFLWSRAQSDCKV